MSKSPHALSIVLSAAAALATAACSSEVDTSADASPDAAFALDRVDAAVDVPADASPAADAEAPPAPTFVVGGTISGLLGAGLVLGVGSESLPVARDGAFRFETPFVTGDAYRVEVRAQPTSPHQTCAISVDTAAGTINNADVRTVAVTCSTDTFAVHVAVSGLVGGGLVLENGGERLSVEADGPQSFATPIASGAPYAVTVHSQPSSGLQHCRVQRGEGLVVDAAIMDVAVVCESMDCVSTATITVGIHTHDVDVHGADLALWQGEGAGALELYDVSDPSQVTLTGSVALDTFPICNYAGSARFAPGGDYVYVYGGGCVGLPVIDVRDRQRPQAIAMPSVSLTPYRGTMDLALCGSMAYAAIQGSGVAAIDVTDPSAPVLADESVIDGQSYPYKVSCVVHDAELDYVYLGDGGSSGLAGLRVFAFDKRARRLTALGSHAPDTSSWGGAALPVSESQIYVPFGNPTRLALFDVSDKQTISAPTTFEIYPNFNARLLRLGHHLVVLEGLSLLYVDIAVPTAPVRRYSKTVGTPEASVGGVSAFSAGGRRHLAYTQNGGTTLSLCRVQGMADDTER
jgi:hypothetical protein